MAFKPFIQFQPETNGINIAEVLVIQFHSGVGQAGDAKGYKNAGGEIAFIAGAVAGQRHQVGQRKTQGMIGIFNLNVSFDTF